MDNNLIVTRSIHYVKIRIMSEYFYNYSFLMREYVYIMYIVYRLFAILRSVLTSLLSYIIIYFSTGYFNMDNNLIVTRSIHYVKIRIMSEYFYNYSFLMREYVYIMYIVYRLFAILRSVLTSLLAYITTYITYICGIRDTS